jgi:hypothetical protein
VRRLSTSQGDRLHHQPILSGLEQGCPCLQNCGIANHYGDLPYFVKATTEWLAQPLSDGLASQGPGHCSGLSSSFMVVHHSELY